MKTNQIDVKRIDSIASDYAAWVKRVEFQKKQKEREMNERARNYFSVSAKERALELLLWQQVSGHNK